MMMSGGIRKEEETSRGGNIKRRKHQEEETSRGGRS
jgi:hypothetical protein